MTTVLIDADSLLYACGFACQKTVYDVTWFDEDGNVIEERSYDTKQLADEARHSTLGVLDSRVGSDLSKRMVSEPVENAIHLLKTQVEKIVKATNATSKRVFLSGGTNFRDALATRRAYKGNRHDTPKPTLYSELYKFGCRFYHAEISANCEADDEISIAANELWTRGEDYVIAHIDKDLNQIIGKHYHYKKDVLYLVDEDIARYNFWVQALAGDPTDNVPGCPGIGTKTAEKLLKGLTNDVDYYKASLDAYKTNVSTTDGSLALNETAALVYLLKHRDDKWEPPIL